MFALEAAGRTRDEIEMTTTKSKEIRNGTCNNNAYLNVFDFIIIKGKTMRFDYPKVQKSRDLRFHVAILPKPFTQHLVMCVQN